MKNDRDNFTHRNNRRKKNHDYCAPWKYHITNFPESYFLKSCSMEPREERTEVAS